MKKDKEESPLKAARKKTREAIEARLLRHLKNITTEIGQEAIDIEKEAKKLAKKITKGLKKTTAEKPANGTVKTAEKPINKPVSDVKKPVIKTAPAKTTTPKAAVTKATPAVKPKK